MGVTAFSHEEMGLQNDFVVFFSKEISPTKTPENLKFARLSSTSINVTWSPLSLFEAQGFPIYKITLTLTSYADGRNKRQSSSSVLITKNNFVVFTNLNSNKEYSLTVGVATEGSSNFTNSQPTKGIQLFSYVIARSSTCYYMVKIRLCILYVAMLFN